MVALYYLVSPSTNGIYVGVSKNPRLRMVQHKAKMKTNYPSYLYKSWAKTKDYCLVVVAEYPNRSLAEEQEVIHIKYLREVGANVFNIESGGSSGFKRSIGPLYEVWKEGLRLSRVGRKPALGMKHSEANKKFFGEECQRRRAEKYGSYDREVVVALPFREATKVFGISKTHYYRLLKRAKANDLG